MESIVAAISAFANWLYEKIILPVLKWLNDLWQGNWDALLQLPQLFYSWIADGLIAFFVWLPVPEFFTTAAQAFSSVPPDIIFYANALQISEGIAMCLSAYLLRFILRRIPGIG